MDSNLNTLSEELSGKLYEVTSVFTHPLYHALNTPPYGYMHPMTMGMGMGPVGHMIYSPMYNHNPIYYH